jgi:hypothetical protein
MYRWLEKFAEIFAVAVGGFSVMDYHLQLFLRLGTEVAQGSPDLEAVQSWERRFWLRGYIASGEKRWGCSCSRRGG